MITVETISTPTLGDRSYLATDGSSTVVVDPQRDVGRVMDLIHDRGLTLTHVLETHIHNDYVSGGREIVGLTGAAHVVAADEQVAFDRLGVRDGDVLVSGDLRVRALHTPGHTPLHMSYALADLAGTVHSVFTGGSMLYGATGRTDLAGAEFTLALTSAQFHSVNRLAAELPAAATVFPTHGFGSFCSATPPTGEISTIGAERTANPALTMPEQVYVEWLIASLDAYPTYYAQMGPINRSGPRPMDVSDPRPVEPGELRRRIEAGEWVVDLRSRTAFAAGHLAGTKNFEGSANFISYLGWLYTWGAPLTLIGESIEQVRAARLDMVRIGIDEVAGAAVGAIAALAGGAPLARYAVGDFAGLAAAMSAGQVHVLDTRRNDEFRAEHVRGAQHIPLHELAARAAEVAQGSVWIYCRTGYRAAVAASMLSGPGREVVLIDGAFADAGAAGVPLASREPAVR